MENTGKSAEVDPDRRAARTADKFERAVLRRVEGEEVRRRRAAQLRGIGL